VGEELVRPLDVLLVHVVADEVLDGDDDGLLHLVRDHDADLLALVVCCVFSAFSAMVVPLTRTSRAD
jgi:hypothetical protein